MRRRPLRGLGDLITVNAALIYRDLIHQRPRAAGHLRENTAQGSEDTGDDAQNAYISAQAGLEDRTDATPMNDNDLLVLVILAIVAGFLLFRLRSVLGDRSGFEDHKKYARPESAEQAKNGAADEDDANNVVAMPRRGDDQADADIFAYTEIDTPLGQELKAIKVAEPGFDLRDFVEGSKGAYEMLLMAYETGDKSTLRTFLADEVFEAFASAIDQRAAQKLSVDMRFVGIRSAEPVEASFNQTTREAEVAVKFVAEIVMVVRNAQGEVVEGDPGAVRRIGDTWTFGRVMGGGNPNWTLIATGE